MIFVLWLRAARFLNWFNWNSNINGSTNFVLQSVSEIKNLEVGQEWTITSVNRTTGKITMSND